MTLIFPFKKRTNKKIAQKVFFNRAFYVRVIGFLFGAPMLKLLQFWFAFFAYFRRRVQLRNIGMTINSLFQ